MPSDLERLAFLGVDPASLDPAPSQPVRADWLARIDMHSPDRRRCCSCRALAVATRVVDLAELGLRWHDPCRACMIAGIRLNWAAGRPMEGRYRVTLWAGDRPALEGWWDELATAEDKTTRWIDVYGSREGALMALVENRPPPTQGRPHTRSMDLPTQTAPDLGSDATGKGLDQPCLPMVFRIQPAQAGTLP